MARPIISNPWPDENNLPSQAGEGKPLVLKSALAEANGFYRFGADKHLRFSARDPLERCR